MTNAFDSGRAFISLRRLALTAIAMPATLAACCGAAFAQTMPAGQSPGALQVAPLAAPDARREAAPPPTPGTAPAELPKFLDDRRLQEIEGQARPLFEAMEQRRAEKQKRKAMEADLKRNAEEVRRAVDSMNQSGAAGPSGTIVDILGPAQAVAAPVPPEPPAAPDLIPTPPSAPPAAVRAAIGGALPFVPAPATAPPGGAACPKGTVTTSPLAGGRVSIELSEPCRKGEPVTIRYAPYLFIRPLDGTGRMRFVLDLFQGVEPPLSVQFKDGESRPIAIGPTDIDSVSKVAVIWGKPVNLDLHVFEYAAAAGAIGHVWSKASSTAEAARDETARTKRGRGFLSFSSNGTEPGHQVEVYTLWHHPEQASGVIATAVDFETRGATAAGATCGQGELAQIPFETVTVAPKHPPVRERGVIAAVRCGDKLLEKARYLDEAVADLTLTLN